MTFSGNGSAVRSGRSAVSLLLVLCGMFLGLLAPGCVAQTALPPFERPYLTWQGDPSTTITVNFQTVTTPKTVEVRYDTASHTGKPDAYSAKATAGSHQVEGLADKRSVNSAELTGLKPGTHYYFVFQEENGEFSKEYQFQTIANDGRMIRFVDGGDVGEFPSVPGLFKSAAAQDPAFVEIGGDIAYEGGNLDEFSTVDAWLDLWTDAMTASDGRLIPLVAVIGNHEVNHGSGTKEQRAPFYYGYYPQGGKSYFVRDFGPNLRFIALDSDHTVAHADQADWLREQLQSPAGKHRIASYHVPLFPSHREFTSGDSDSGRRVWMPLFDKFHLCLGLEHHDHTFKRTKALLGGEPDPAGTVYLGDGCMGQDPREVDTSRYYIEKAAQSRNFWVIDVDAEKVSCRAIGEDGKVFDECEVK
jgi:hypothetical protein